MPESVSTRAAAVVGAAGLGVAAVLAGAVLVAGGSASAAATCAPATESPSATDTPTDEPTDSASPDPSDTGAPSPSSTANGDGGLLSGGLGGLVPLGNGQGTTTGTPEPTSTDSAEPTDSASADPSSSSSTAKTTVTLAPRRVVKGDPVRVTGTGLPGCRVQVLGYTRPNTTYKVVRTGTVGDNGKFSFTVYPPSNTRVYAKSEGASDSTSTVVNVRFVLSLKVARVGVRTYRFEGGLGPAASGVHVTIYRAVKGGSPVKVGTVDTSNGKYSLTHRFSGTGTFNFYAVATTTTNNDSNRSALVASSIK